MSYYVKYYLYRYLNRRHSTFEKRIALWLVLSTLLGLGLPSSFKVGLRAEVFSGSFKLVFRRVAWLTQFRYLKRSLIEDKFFDFSIGLNSESARDMYYYTKNRKSCFRNLFLYEVTLAQLSSAVLESQVKPGECIDIRELDFSEFDQKFLDHASMAETFLLEKALLSRAERKKKTLLESKKKTLLGSKKKSKWFNINLMERHSLGVLSHILSLQERLGIDIFVISGTFLGLHRESGFLAHDYDIDLGIFESDYTSRLLDELNYLDGFLDISLDYPCFREVNAKGGGYYKTQVPALIKLHHNSGVQIDIFIHFEEGEIYWHGSSLHRWENLKFNLVERRFLGLNVLAPLEADRYLTENYGDWRTPVKKFNCSTGTPNITNSSSCKTKCYFLKREYFSL